MGNFIEHSSNFWKTQSNGNLLERQAVYLNNIPEVARQKKFLCTSKEFDSYLVIAKAYKTFKFKDIIQQRIKRNQLKDDLNKTDLPGP